MADPRRSSDWRQAVAETLGDSVVDVVPLSGGCIGQVYRVHLSKGGSVVAKVAEAATSGLSIEAYMLRYLRANSDLPVPEVLHSNEHLLVLEFVPGQSRFSAEAQHSAAELLAALHDHSAPSFGLERDTLIGGLHQPNPWTATWLEFFAEHRLRYMAREARHAGRLPQDLLRRVDAFADKIDNWLEEPAKPALIHGDVWTTNVLAQGGRITAFLDPAIYYAHEEIELAFTTLFGTFGEPFFERYASLRPLQPGFFDTRRHIYNLYPLLVHVRLFGGSYVASVDQVLRRFGF